VGGVRSLTRDYTHFFDLQEADVQARQAVQREFLDLLSGDLQRMGLLLELAQSVAHQLWNKMSAPARRYHSAIHVLGMLGYAQKMGLHLSDAERLATWFHDSVYDASAPNARNESESARFLTDSLGGGPVASQVVNQAAEAIRWTAHHTRNDVPPEHHQIMDLDLAGFLAPPDVFARQSAALRREYAHLSDAQYAAGTIEFLRGLLARRTIYYTPPFAARENDARHQIQAEIQRLGSVARTSCSP
jgi:predicted metal-dependent HD superfamily phosphohydrolase